MIKLFKKQVDTRISEELLNQYEFYKIAFELSNSIKLVLNGTRIIKFNERANTIFKFNSTTLDFCDIIDNSDNCICNDLIKGTPPKLVTLKIIPNKNESFIADVSFSPVYVGGKLLTFVVIQDITELRKAQNDSHMFMTALNEATHGICITDEKGDFVWANKAAIAMTGYTFSELIGQNPRILKSGLMDSDVYTNLWNTVVSGKIWKGELINKRKDGSTYVDYTTIIPVERNGKIVNYIAIKEDYTFKFPEEHIEELRDLAYLEKTFEFADIGFVVLDINSDLSYEVISINKSASNILDGLDKKDQFTEERIHIYYNVLSTGKPTKFIMTLDSISKQKYEFYAFRPVKNRVAVLFKKFD